MAIKHKFCLYTMSCAKPKCNSIAFARSFIGIDEVCFTISLHHHPFLCVSVCFDSPFVVVVAVALSTVVGKRITLRSHVNVDITVSFNVICYSPSSVSLLTFSVIYPRYYMVDNNTKMNLMSTFSHFEH